MDGSHYDGALRQAAESFFGRTNGGTDIGVILLDRHDDKAFHPVGTRKRIAILNGKTVDFFMLVIDKSPTARRLCSKRTLA